MKKLLMVTGLGSAKDLALGKKSAFYNTLEEFHKHWERIDIIIPKIHGEAITNLFGNVYLHVSPWPLIFHPLFFIKKGLSLHKKYHFDLMTVQEYPPFYNGIGAYLLSVMTQIPYVLEIHHVPGYPKSANFKEAFYRFLTRIFIALDSLPAKAVRVVNKFQTKDFLVRSGVTESKIIYIPSLYIDNCIYKPAAELKEYDLVFVGRLEKNKGINLFLEVVKKINCRAVIVGDGSLVGDIKLKIENWKLQDRIMMHGWAKDSKEIANILNKSKLLVMPSFNEGGPRVVMEAMACGVPVLATPVGIIPDIKGSCVVIDWNIDDITEKAQHILGNEQEYNNKVNLGLETAQQFGKEISVKNYADKIKSLI